MPVVLTDKFLRYLRRACKRYNLNYEVSLGCIWIYDEYENNYEIPLVEVESLSPSEYKSFIQSKIASFLFGRYLYGK